nr:CoA transferase [Pseudomonas psychrotolerans]
MTLGKRCARLDLRRPADRRVFEALLEEADVLVHGYRADALERLGYGAAQRRALQPALIDVSLCAYGWTGPWALRRGYDSLVQLSCGIAAAGRDWQQAQQPVPLPVQALDHATGYLMAAAVIRGITGRLREGRVLSARLSLARTACLLTEHPAVACAPLYTGVQDADYDATPSPPPGGRRSGCARRCRSATCACTGSGRLRGWDRRVRPGRAQAERVKSPGNSPRHRWSGSARSPGRGGAACGGRCARGCRRCGR